MLRNIIVLLGLTLAVGLISAGLTYFRAGSMSPVRDIETKGLAAVQKGNITFFGVMIPLLVAVIAFFVYRAMLARYPATVHTYFFWLAVGVGVILSIAAAVVFKMRGFWELTALHVVYIACFGWILPLIWTV